MKPPPLSHGQREHGHRHTLIEQRRQSDETYVRRASRTENENTPVLAASPFYHTSAKKSRGEAEKREGREPQKKQPRSLKSAIIQNYHFVSVEGANRGGDHSQDKSPPRGKAPDARVIAETAARAGLLRRSTTARPSSAPPEGAGGAIPAAGQRLPRAQTQTAPLPP